MPKRTTTKKVKAWAVSDGEGIWIYATRKEAKRYLWLGRIIMKCDVILHLPTLKKVKQV